MRILAGKEREEVISRLAKEKDGAKWRLLTGGREGSDPLVPAHEAVLVDRDRLGV